MKTKIISCQKLAKTYLRSIDVGVRWLHLWNTAYILTHTHGNKHACEIYAYSVCFISDILRTLMLKKNVVFSKVEVMSMIFLDQIVCIKMQAMGMMS